MQAVLEGYTVKTLIATATLMLAMTAGAATAMPMHHGMMRHHHRAKVCRMHHHHRMCTYR